MNLLGKNARHKHLHHFNMGFDFSIQVLSPLKYYFEENSLLLGTGSYGTCVYVGIMKNGSEVAVKRMLLQLCEHSAENEKEI